MSFEGTVRNVTVRPFVGLGVPLNPNALTCDHSIGESSYAHCLTGHAGDGKASILPYAGTAIGILFDLGG